MASYKTVKNSIDNKDYFISIIPTNKRVVTSSSKPPYDLSFEAAIFAGRPKISRIFRKPILVIQKLFDEVVTESKFTQFIYSLVSNENMVDLQKGSYSIYEKYGYVAVPHDFYYIFWFSKIRHIIILKK